MSNISNTRTDMSAFESQFDSSAPVAPTPGQFRVRGWAIVLAASVALWGGIAVAIAAAIHALS
jgi:hypothetical protein